MAIGPELPVIVRAFSQLAGQGLAGMGSVTPGEALSQVPSESIIQGLNRVRLHGGGLAGARFNIKDAATAAVPASQLGGISLQALGLSLPLLAAILAGGAVDQGLRESPFNTNLFEAFQEGAKTPGRSLRGGIEAIGEGVGAQFAKFLDPAVERVRQSKSLKGRSLKFNRNTRRQLLNTP